VLLSYIFCALVAGQATLLEFPETINEPLAPIAILDPVDVLQ